MAEGRRDLNGADRRRAVRAADAELPDGIEDGGDPRRALLELATAAAGIGAFDWDLGSGTLSWDERLLELFGYDEGSFDRTIEAFNARLHPEDLPRVSALLQHTIDTCGDFEADYRVLVPGVPARWLAARGRALCDEQGRTVRLLGVAWDISARAAAQDRLAQILETMAVGFVLVDGDWTITAVNARAERILGIPQAQLLGRAVGERFPAAVGTVFEENYRRAVATGAPVVFDAYYPAPLNLWVEVRAVPGPEGVSLYFLDITERRRAQQHNEQAGRRERLLGRITDDLVATLQAEQAATRLSRLVVPALADWCLVTLLDDDRHTGHRRGLRAAAAWHVDPALRETVESYAQLRLAALEDDAVIVRALHDGQTQLLQTGAAAEAGAMLAPGPARDLLATLAPASIVVLPLPGRTGPVGLLTLANGTDRGPFAAEDMTTARHVAARAGLVLDNARLYRQQRDLAEGLQRSLLTPPPEPDHLQVAVRYTPAALAAQVGGDWYDAFLQPDGATVLVIGDVIGHDVASAAAMGQIRSIVRTLGAEDSRPPADMLRRTDRVMETLQIGTAATALVARLEQTPDELARGVTRLRWSNAGHLPPMVLQPDGTVRRLTSSTVDRLLGVTPETLRHEAQIVLDRGAVVLLYTDGLVERRDQDLDAGLDRLEGTLVEMAGLPLEELCDQLLARMLPDRPDDDVALVAVRLHPQDRPRPAEAGPIRIPPGIPDDPASATPLD